MMQYTAPPSPLIPEFPQGLRSNFEVVSVGGNPIDKTWVLKDCATGEHYRLSRSTVAGWDIPVRDEVTRSVIIYGHNFGRSFVALDLATGEIYRTRAHSSRLSK